MVIPLVFFILYFIFEHHTPIIIGIPALLVSIRARWVYICAHKHTTSNNTIDKAIYPPSCHAFSSQIKLCNRLMLTSMHAQNNLYWYYKHHLVHEIVIDMGSCWHKHAGLVARESKTLCHLYLTFANIIYIHSCYTMKLSMMRTLLLLY